jgi:MFS superfamily sulfate permease-like transporter
MSKSKSLFANAKNDLVAGVIVFLIALPLCLGIAQASNAPLLSGIVAGVVGGVVIGLFSKSNLSVSGPAAGLVAIVIGAIEQLGAFEIFLCAVIIGGGVQLLLGLLRAGTVANFRPV